MSTTITKATAGPSGEKIRSDLVVRYEPGTEPLAVTVSSKVDYLYGEAIEAAVQDVVAQLKELQRQEMSRIVTPGEVAPGLAGLGGAGLGGAGLGGAGTPSKIVLK